MGLTAMDWGRHRVLVLAPHADDETFGCGGLIAKVKAEGGAVYVIVASVGDLHHYGAREEALEFEPAPLVAGADRARELEKAMAVLGVDGYEVLFTDPGTHLRLDAMPRRDLVAYIERDARYAMDKVEPTVLILPEISYNQDHETLFKAGFTACRPHLPADKPFVQIVLSCDAPQLGWSFQPFHPNFYVDITPYLKTKLRAHACHDSQLKPPPHHASLENLERLARLRGAEVAVEAAEAFRCHRFMA